MSEFAIAYKELLRVDSQSNSSPLREEFQVRSLLDAVIVAVNLSIIRSKPQLYDLERVERKSNAHTPR